MQLKIWCGWTLAIMDLAQLDKAARPISNPNVLIPMLCFRTFVGVTLDRLPKYKPNGPYILLPTLRRDMADG